LRANRLIGNRTESKATTVWPVKDLQAVLPKLMHDAVRGSKYYTAGNDSWTIQAQTHRSRSANLDENEQKLTEEVERIYESSVPGETSDEKKDKHRNLWAP
jgi:peptidyl-tRNA hydrolase ICT1